VSRTEKRIIEHECWIIEDKCSWRYAFTSHSNTAVCLLRQETVEVSNAYNLKNITRQSISIFRHNLSESNSIKRSHNIIEKLSRQQKILAKTHQHERLQHWPVLFCRSTSLMLKLLQSNNWGCKLALLFAVSFSKPSWVWKSLGIN